MTTERTRRTVTVTIQAIATKKGTQGEYCTVTTQPRPGMKYPDNYNAWDTEVVKGFQAGDAVVLTLEQGKPRVDNPQKENDYYWDLVHMAQATGQTQVGSANQPHEDPRPQGNITPALSQTKPIKPYQDPRDQSIQRQVALKAAVELGGYHIAKGEAFGAKEVLAVAQKFAEWLAQLDAQGKGKEG